MNHIFALFFAMVLGFGHSQTAAVHPADEFVPPAEVTMTVDSLPARSHALTARRVVYNSYAETGCSTCLMTNATLPPHLLWRAPR